MIGATDHDDALREARRSITGPADWDGLQIWDEASGRYESVPLPAIDHCPFCGSEATLGEKGRPGYWAVICTGTLSLLAACSVDQIPSSTKRMAIIRWNMRAPVTA